LFVVEFRKPNQIMSYDAENPFEDSNSFESKGAVNQAHVAPTFTQPTYTPSTASTASIQSLNTGVDMNEESIARKEAELRVREQQLQQREQQLIKTEASAPAGSASNKNWPPCKPIIHHDIAGDIPAGQQNLIRRAYAGWYMQMVGLLWNLVTVTAVLVTKGEIAGFFLGLAFTLVSVPMSFLVYRLLYNAAKKAKISYYHHWILNIWWSFLVYGWLGVGIYGWGGGGVITAIRVLGDNTIVGIFAIVDAVVMALIILYHFYLFIRARTERNKLT
jgi:hypothetical protein